MNKPERRFSVYFAPPNLLGGIANKSHWKIISSRNTSTKKGLMTLEEAKEFAIKNQPITEFSGYVFIKDRTEFDCLFFDEVSK